MDFGTDEKAVQQGYQYMFGKSMLVAPVTEAGAVEWDVYLPKNAVWFDFWTGKKYSGGQKIAADASQNKIPVFVKSGSIIPVGAVKQYSAEKTDAALEIRIYSGANGRFQLYEDEGDGYNYEKGKYTIIPFTWNDVTKTLQIGAIQGSFPGYLKNRTFNILLVKDGDGINNPRSASKTVIYQGKGVVTSLK
jgi:alpha-D-xyloside xylohydrolase